MYHILCIDNSVQGHLGSFQILAILYIYKTAMNIGDHVSLIYIGTSFVYVPRSGIAGYSSNTISNILRKLQTYLQSGCTSMQFLKQWESVPPSPHPHQHLLSRAFLIFAILNGVRWNLRVVWFACPWWLRMLNISLDPSHSFPFPQFTILHLALFPNFEWGYLVLWNLTPWVICLFWILAPCRVYDW